MPGRVISLLPDTACFRFRSSWLGIVGGTLLVHADRQRALRRISVRGRRHACPSASLGAYLAWPAWLGIVFLSSAMGLLNTSVTQVGGQPISLGFMTGDLNNLAQHISQAILRAPVSQAQGPRDTHWRRAALLSSLWIFFLAGAILGAALSSRLALWTLLLPAGLLVLLALFEPQAISAD